MVFWKRLAKISLIVAVCGVIWIGMQITTPVVDVFSFVGFHGKPNPKTGALQTITYTFRKEDFVKEVQSLKPNVDEQTVKALADSIEISIKFIDTPGEWVDDEQTYDPRYRAYIANYDKKLKREIGIRFYRDSVE